MEKQKRGCLNVREQRKNHPVTEGGEIKQDSTPRVLHSTVNCKEPSLEDELRKAAKHFHFPETMDAEVVFDIMLERGKIADRDLPGLRKLRSKIRNRPKMQGTRC